MSSAFDNAPAVSAEELRRQPALLFFFEHEARVGGHADLADECAAILDASFPDFRARAGEQNVERELLDAMGLGGRAVVCSFWESGHLRELRAGDKPALALAQHPGNGTFVDEGKRGGSGWAVSERYENGQLHSTTYSPWSDGEEASRPTPWLVWVLQRAADVMRAAPRG